VTLAPIRDRLNWQPDLATYQAIRRLWIDHSKAEDARDLAGLIATLSEGVYEIVPTGQRWEGHSRGTRGRAGSPANASITTAARSTEIQRSANSRVSYRLHSVALMLPIH
jgi:hypothetical protein